MRALPGPAGAGIARGNTSVEPGSGLRLARFALVVHDEGLAGDAVAAVGPSGEVEKAAPFAAERPELRLNQPFATVYTEVTLAHDRHCTNGERPG